MSANKIVFFDFDGTITKSDSLLSFLKFYYPKPTFLLKSLLFAPKLIAQKLKLINNSKAKEDLTSLFFKGESLTVFNQKCQVFAKNELPKLILPAAKKTIENYLAKGTNVVIVSASYENYLQFYFQPLGIDVLGTKLMSQNKKLNGKFEGKNCYGQEKVQRIKEKYKLQEYEEILAYGDTKGDLPMLNLADKSFYKPFR